MEAPVVEVQQGLERCLQDVLFDGEWTDADASELSLHWTGLTGLKFYLISSVETLQD